MKTNKELLSSILKTTQMGQIGIRSVLDTDPEQKMRNALESQLREYDTIESEAHAITQQRGWVVPEQSPAVRRMTDMMTKMQLSALHTDSKIAEMMIKGNTKGMVKGLRNLHDFAGEDCRVSSLSRKLIETETANIQQMKEFL